jgi:hypothetical protein
MAVIAAVDSQFSGELGVVAGQLLLLALLSLGNMGPKLTQATYTAPPQLAPRTPCDEGFFLFDQSWVLLPIAIAIDCH